MVFTLTRKLSFLIMNIIAILIFVATSYIMIMHLLLGQSSNNSIADPISIYSPPPQPYEYHFEESYFWEQNESNCIHVDNICSIWDANRTTGEWFYYTTTTTTTQWNNNNNTNNTHQSSIRLVQRQGEIGRHDKMPLKINERIKFDVLSASSYQSYKDDKDICSFSQVPYHLVVHSGYNHMIGEFYSRTILGLNQWLRDYPLR